MSRIGYQEYHFANVKDLTIAFNNENVWVRLDGFQVLRAEAILNRKNPALYLEYNPPSSAERDAWARIESIWLGLNKADRAEVIEHLQRAGQEEK